MQTFPCKSNQTFQSGPRSWWWTSPGLNDPQSVQFTSRRLRLRLFCCINIWICILTTSWTGQTKPRPCSADLLSLQPSDSTTAVIPAHSGVISISSSNIVLLVLLLICVISPLNEPTPGSVLTYSCTCHFEAVTSQVLHFWLLFVCCL